MQSDRLDHLVAARLRAAATALPATALRATVRRLAAVDPLAVSVTDQSGGSVSGLRCERLVLSHAMRHHIPATLLAPHTGGPHPAVLFCAGRNATLDRVTGVEPPDFPDRNVAEQLARAGFVTLTLDYGIDAPLEHALTLCGGSLLGALVEDALAALDWLAQHPLVDPDRIGLCGHSLGAAVALHTALVREPAVPVCAASHLGTYRCLYTRLRTGPEGGALPGILRYADLPDLYGALAPTPLQLQYGSADAFLDPVDSASAADVVRQGYAAAEAMHQLEVLALPMGHGTSVPDAVDFFTRVLTAPMLAPTRVPAARIVFDVAARVEILDRVDAAVASGALTLGRYGRELEELAAGWTGRPTAAVSSGSSSLEIALRIVGVAGRAVLLPVNTFFATAASAVRAGATVDFVDMEPDGLGLDPEALRRALADRDDVAAVVPVHIAGIVSPALRDVLGLCAERGIAVVEDAAHALGSTLARERAGQFGRMGCFSLYPTKVVTSGEGGLLSCESTADLHDAWRYRDQGKATFESNVHGVLGSNWRMSELHAAVGIAHLHRLAGILAERHELAGWYDEHIAGLPRVRRHRVPAGVSSNHYKYVALLKDGVARDELVKRLRAHHGISLAGGVYDTLLHQQPYFAAAFGSRRFPVAERFAAQHICLPLFAGMTRRQQQAVIDALRSELT